MLLFLCCHGVTSQNGNHSMIINLGELFAPKFPCSDDAVMRAHTLELKEHISSCMMKLESSMGRLEARLILSTLRDIGLDTCRYVWGGVGRLPPPSLCEGRAPPLGVVDGWVALVEKPRMDWRTE